MQIIEITENKSHISEVNIEPNVIKNRFDILYQNASNSIGGGIQLYKLRKGNTEAYIQTFKHKNFIELGMYMRKIDDNMLSEFIKYLFKTNKKAQALYFSHTLNCLDGIDAKPHWHINLPKTIEEFDNQLASKVRYNTKWYPKKIRKELGEYTIDKIPTNEISEELVKLYLTWKATTYKFQYSVKNYLQDFGVSYGYILKTQKNILAIGFTCETNTKDVYFENFSYNPDFSKYSAGTVLYHAIIKDLIENKKRCFYLLGGNLDYKKRYNGIKTLTYSGYIYRNSNYAKILRNINNKINTLKMNEKGKKYLKKIFKAITFEKCYRKIFDE